LEKSISELRVLWGCLCMELWLSYAEVEKF